LNKLKNDTDKLFVLILCIRVLYQRIKYYPGYHIYVTYTRKIWLLPSILLK